MIRDKIYDFVDALIGKLLGDLTFVDETSGMRMRKDRWYITSDSGSSMCAIGFVSSADALAHTRSKEFTDEYGDNLEPVVLTFEYDSDGRMEAVGSVEGCAIVNGGDLAAYCDNLMEEEALYHEQAVG